MKTIETIVALEEIKINALKHINSDIIVSATWKLSDSQIKMLPPYKNMKYKISKLPSTKI